MCGIAGVFHRRGEAPDRAVLDRMTDRLVHRGPDGRGVYVHEGVGFGHRRLSIVGVSDGAQPMSNEDGTVWVTFNGEIYNYPELKAELSRRGHVFRTHSDTEVLVHGWEEWGERVADHLRGIFAFVLHDQRQRVVFAVRDRLGVKPLFYVLTPELFAFASEIKALLVHPAVPKRPDLEGVALYLRHGYVPTAGTCFAGIQELRPGATLRVDAREAREVRYWLPREVGLGRVERIDETLDHLVDDAVRSELMSEVPLGALLSGGVDSSTVAAAMARARGLGERPKTFCIGFSEAEWDESAHSKTVAAHLDLDHHVEIVDRSHLDLLSTLVEVYDEPFGDSSAIPTYELCKMTKKHVTVALSGDGGDEVFAGYRRYQWLDRYRELPGPMRRAAGELGRVYPRHARGALRLQRWSETLDHQMEGLHRVLDPGLLAEVVVPGQLPAPSWSMAEMFRAAPGETAVQKAQWVELQTYLPGDILVKVDRASMAFALEVRVPLLDHHLVEWALRLPLTETFGPSGEGKVALKRHLGRRLPRGVFERPKMGFGVPLSRWMGGESGLGEQIERLRARHPRREFYSPIRADRVAALSARTSGVDRSQAIWILSFLEAWWQRHFV